MSTPSSEISVRSLARRGLTYLPAFAIPAILGIALIPYLARVLGPQEFGIYAGCLTLHGFMLMLGADPTTGTLKRWYARAKADDQSDGLVRGLLGLSIALIIGMTLVATAAILVATQAEALTPWRAALLATVAFTAGFTLFQFLLTIQYVQQLAARAAKAQVGHSFVKVGAIALGAGFFATAAGSLISYAIVLIGLCALLFVLAGRGRRRPERNLRVWREGMSYGGPLILVSVSFVILAGLDRLILAASIGVAEAGRYAAAYLIADGAVSLPAMLLHYTVYTGAVNSWEGGNHVLAGRLLERTVDVMITIGVVVVFAFAMVGDDLIRIMNGADFAVSAQALVAIASGLVLYRVGTFEAVGYELHLETGSLARAYGAAAIFCVPVTTVAVLIGGLMGAAIGTALSYLAFLLVIRFRSPARATNRYPSWKLALALGGMLLAFALASV